MKFVLLSFMSVISANTGNGGGAASGNKPPPK